jgi:hypothetical protein
MTQSFQPISKAMIVIAVSRYEAPYPALPGTLTSAKRMADWAKAPGDGRGYDVLEIDDREGKAVTVARLREEIEPFLLNRIIDRLIVYFAGHGLVRSASDQFWLLTNAANSRREGVNLMEFIDSLQRYGIGAANAKLHKGQLSIIADACRNTTTIAIDFIGDAILTPAAPPKPMEIDFLMATTLGHFAFQPNAVEGGEPYCLFSDTLLDALEGKVPEVIEDQGHIWAPVIPNDRLATYIDTEVPIRAAIYHEEMTPDTVTGLRRDHNYYDLIRPATANGHPESLAPDAPPTAATRVAQTEKSIGYASFQAASNGYRHVTDRAQWLCDQLLPVTGRPAILSEFIDQVAIPDDLTTGFRRRGDQWAFTSLRRELRPIFVRREVGWTIAPLMPLTVAILPPDAPGDIILQGGDEQWDLSLSTAFNSAQAKTDGLAARLREADKLRIGKDIRPNSANLVAYAYTLAGDPDTIVRTARYMMINGYVSFDLAALCAEQLDFGGREAGWRITANLPAVDPDDDQSRPDYARKAFDKATDVQVDGIFPIFRQGWARLAKGPFELPDAYRKLAELVLPYAPTVFPDSAMDILAEEFGYRTASVKDIAEEISR